MVKWAAKFCPCDCPTCVAARSDSRLCFQVRNFTSSFPLLSGNYQRLPLLQARSTPSRASAHRLVFVRMLLSTCSEDSAFSFYYTHSQSVRKRPISWSCVSRKEVTGDSNDRRTSIALQSKRKADSVRIGCSLTEVSTPLILWFASR
jgi:hypothetical protein